MSKSWLLAFRKLAWLVPATTTLAENLWPQLPNATLVRIISSLLAVVIVGPDLHRHSFSRR